MKRLLVLVSVVAFIGCASAPDKMEVIAGKFDFNLDGGPVELDVNADDALYISVPTKAKPGQVIYDVGDITPIVEKYYETRGNR